MTTILYTLLSFHGGEDSYCSLLVYDTAKPAHVVPLLAYILKVPVQILAMTLNTSISMLSLNLFMCMPGKYLKSGYDHFLPHSFQFIIYHNPII
jgi:hypothetical protein